MGGHGALTIGLKHPDLFKSISAFSPISNPISVPWGQKAFSGYLGDDKASWKQYDATELVITGVTLSDLLLHHQTGVHCTVMQGRSNLRSCVMLLQVKGYKGPVRKILIDVGTKDDFLENQLKPDVLAKAASDTPVSVDLRLQVRAAAQGAIDRAAVHKICISPKDLSLIVQVGFLRVLLACRMAMIIRTSSSPHS